MEIVGIREMKNRLSEFVRQVRDGHRVLLTDRGKLVAQLSQVDPSALDSLDYEGTARLEADGLLSSRGQRLDESPYTPLSPLIEGISSGELLDAVRSDD